MGSYRLEQASTGRAGCQNKECKDSKTKIAKGELRFGTWVDTERIQAFMWRHWGCITPKLITNLNETINEEGGGEGEEKDYTVIDGYEDLPEKLQQKVRGALEQGHVDDEDWKGDVEMNRPGKTGFRVRKKAGAAAKKDEEEKDTPKPKKRGKAQENENEEEAEKPKAKKTRKDGRGSKKATKEEEESESDNAEEAKEEEAEEKPAPAKKTRGRATRATTTRASRKKQADAAEEGKDEEMGGAEEPAEEEPAEEKPKRGGRKKRAT